MPVAGKEKELMKPRRERGHKRAAAEAEAGGGAPADSFVFKRPTGDEDRPSL